MTDANQYRHNARKIPIQKGRIQSKMKQNRKRLAKCRRITLPPPVTAALCLVLVSYLLPMILFLPHAKGAEQPVSDRGEVSVTEPDLSLLIEDAPAGNSTDTTGNSTDLTGNSTNLVEQSTNLVDKKGKTLRCLLNGELTELALEDYLWGVVAAEMPASFDQDALCAQAVAARTYTLYRMSSTNPNHPDADICGDSTCCQAWVSRDERLMDWSKSEAKTYEKKINKAISKTKGKYLTYDGTPIMAVFHAASASSTKSALEVWGEDYPYLQEVPSPAGEDSAPNYYSTVAVDLEDFRRIITEGVPQAVLRDAPAEWVGSFTYDEAGLPVTVNIGGVTLDTGTVRSLFGLRSASFSAEYDGEKVVFYVTGYGHGVGMSQYGANALAKSGKSWKEILQWYYPNTTLTD